MRHQKSLEDVLCFEADTLSHRVPSEEQALENSVIGDNKLAPLPVADLAIHVIIVAHEDEMGLIAIVIRITDVAEQTFAEITLGECLKIAEVEHLESGHASEVNAMSQVNFEFFDLLF